MKPIKLNGIETKLNSKLDDELIFKLRNEFGDELFYKIRIELHLQIRN